MIEAPKIARQSTNFPEPAEDGRVCELCGGRTFSILHGWEPGNRWNPISMPIAMWKCTCGFTFLHPIPTVDQLPDEGDWWSGQRNVFSRRRRLKTVWNNIRRKLFGSFGSSKRRFLWYIRKVVPSGRFLEAGCGKGEMLMLARRFYECVGIDPSSTAVECAKKLGIHVIQGTLENAELEENSFDVVLLDSVIEHVASPAALLRKAHYVLRDRGVVIVVTPKLNGPSHRLHGAEWNGFRHGYHTFLFTAKTLGLLMRETGFRLLRWPRRNRFLDDILILWGRKVDPEG
jgi:2-polyprenyl-3-methyl-5-hydroxy-6-metoxy-1,4-benzoquinol methylase